MFRYFPDNMLWSQSVMHALNAGAEINEVEEACAPLRPLAAKADRHAWASSWSSVADKVERRAAGDLAAGNRISARRKYRRAALYHLAAERNLELEDPEKADCYSRMRSAMTDYLNLSVDVRAVEIPYEDTSLPGYFVSASQDGPAPVVLVIDGFDVTREMLLFRMMERLQAGGFAMLFVDTPGVGEALRQRGMTARQDTEVPVGACVDYLGTLTNEVDPDRIALLGVSLGGYYAGRAAAYEKRLKATVLWGAIWNAGTNFRRIYSGDANNAPAPPGQLLWVTGAEDVESGLQVLDSFNLEEAAKEIEGPLFVLHGAHDHVIDPDDATKIAAAAVNADVTLHIRNSDEGGVQHCQVDAMPDALDEISDWLKSKLIDHE